jgi:ubiquinone biosynthesis protein UbiJ
MRTLTHKFIEEYLPQVINRYLALDPESKKRLHDLENKVITLELAENIFQLQFISSGIAIKTHNFLSPDAVIKGRPLSLLHMSIDKKNRKKFFAEDISIEGNIEVGQQVIDLFDALEIDWEEYLSQGLGDVAAHQFTRFTRKIQSFGKRIHATLAQNINEYVHEEANVTPPSEALKDFYQDIDNLRMDTDRLEARIQQLATKLANKRDK